MVCAFPSIMQDGYTALHIACSCGHNEIVQELLLAPDIDIGAADKASHSRVMPNLTSMSNRQINCTRICNSEWLDAASLRVLRVWYVLYRRLQKMSMWPSRLIIVSALLAHRRAFGCRSFVTD